MCVSVLCPCMQVHWEAHASWVAHALELPMCKSQKQLTASRGVKEEYARNRMQPPGARQNGRTSHHSPLASTAMPHFCPPVLPSQCALVIRPCSVALMLLHSQNFVASEERTKRGEMRGSHRSCRPHRLVWLSMLACRYVSLGAVRQRRKFTLVEPHARVVPVTVCSSCLVLWPRGWLALPRRRPGGFLWCGGPCRSWSNGRRRFWYCVLLRPAAPSAGSAARCGDQHRAGVVACMLLHSNVYQQHVKHALMCQSLERQPVTRHAPF